MFRDENPQSSEKLKLEPCGCKTKSRSSKSAQVTRVCDPESPLQELVCDPVVEGKAFVTF